MESTLRILHLESSLIPVMKGLLSKDALIPLQAVIINDKEFQVKEVHKLLFKYYPSTKTLRIESGFDFISTKHQVEKFLKFLAISNQKEFLRLYSYTFRHSPGLAQKELYLNSFQSFRNFYIEV